MIKKPIIGLPAEKDRRIFFGCTIMHKGCKLQQLIRVEIVHIDVLDGSIGQKDETAAHGFLIAEISASPVIWDGFVKSSRCKTCVVRQAHHDRYRACPEPAEGMVEAQRSRSLPLRKQGDFL